MAYIERACDFADDGNIVMPEGENRRISPLHAYASVVDIAAGNKTAAQVKGQAWNHGSPPMRATPDASGRSDQADFDALMAKMPASPGDRALWCQSVFATLIQGQQKVIGYATPAEIRGHLGI